MKAEDGPEPEHGDRGRSAGQQAGPEDENTDHSPGVAAPDADSSELVKAMYHWVLSRL
jgi:hypothetical protein